MEAYIHEIVEEGETLTILFSGCDYKCPCCNTPQLVEFRTEEQRDIREVVDEIKSSGASKVLFSGGEPLLQRQALLLLLKAAKESGKRAVLDTNASKPEAIKQLLTKNLVDEFLVDIKASERVFNNVTKSATFFKPMSELFAEFTASLEMLKQAKGVMLSFKTLIVPGLLYKKEDLLAIANMLEGYRGEWLLQPFNPSRTLDPTLQGVAPPTLSFLETLAEMIRKAHPAINVKVKE